MTQNPIQMDRDPDELELKNILVELELEHEHLQVSVRQLQSAVDMRELEIRRLLSERELRLLKDKTNSNYMVGIKKSKTTDFNSLSNRDQAGYISQSDKNKNQKDPDLDIETAHSSDFCRKVNEALDRISSTSEEVLSLIKL